MAFRGRPVTSATLMPNSVATIHIQNLAVTTAKIDNLAVTNAKIANLAVTDAKIDTLTVSKLTAGTLNAMVVTVAAELNLNGTGLFRTAGSGQRVEINGAAIDRISFYSGALGELNPGFAQVAATFYLELRGPETAAGYSSLVLDQTFSRIRTPTQHEVYVGGALRVLTSTTLHQISLPVRVTGTIQANDGSTGLVEVFPLGTYIAAADLFDSTGWAIPNATAQVMSAAAIAVEYANQPVIVYVTFEAEVTGMTPGEYVYLRPTVDGNILGGGLIRNSEPSTAGAIAALTHTAHSAHAAGAAPGFGHSSTGAHAHDVTGRPVYNTSGPASAGTAHTHTAGSYNTALVAGLAASAGAHSAHGTHTIADHSAHSDHAAVAAHTHPKTYDHVVVRSGVYVGNASAGATVTLGLYGRTQTTAATCGRVAFHYLILRG